MAQRRRTHYKIDDTYTSDGPLQVQTTLKMADYGYRLPGTTSPTVR